MNQRLRNMEAELIAMESLSAPLKAEVDKVNGSMARVGDRYEAGEITKEKYDEKRADYRKQLKALEAQMVPADPELNLQYARIRKDIDEWRRWIDTTKLLRSPDDYQMWMEHLLSGEVRETLDKFDVKVWAFPDHIEARGMIPTQTVQRVFTSAPPT